MYAELVRNRAFQGSTVYPANLDGYAPVNGAVLSMQNLSDPLSPSMPTSLNVHKGDKEGKIGFANAGFWGMEVKPQLYTGSFYVKGNYDGDFTITLQSNLTSEVFAWTEVKSAGKHDEWVQYKYTLFPWTWAPNSNNTLAITVDSKVNLVFVTNLTMVSDLFIFS